MISGKKKTHRIVKQIFIGVEFSLRVSMSWQIWWVIPTKLIKIEENILIE